MKKNLTRIIITVICILLAVWFLYPTFQNYSFNKDLQGLTGEDSIKYINENAESIKKSLKNRLKLGLDLKGGMYVVLDVDVIKLLEELANPKAKDEIFTQSLNEVAEQIAVSEEPVLKVFSANLKTKGKNLLSYYGDTRQDESTVENEIQEKIDQAIEGAVRTVRSRIDQYGVAEPQIQTVAGKRIIVELPGVSNADEVRRLLKQTAILEFHLLQDINKVLKVMQDIDNKLASSDIRDSLFLNDTSVTALNEISQDSSALQKSTEKKSAGDKGKKDSAKSKKEISVKKDTTKTEKDTSKSNDTSAASDTTDIDTSEQLTQEEFLQKYPFTSLFDLNYLQQAGELITNAVNKEKINRILQREDIKVLIPNDILFSWSAPRESGEEYYILYALRKEAELTGKALEEVRADIDPNDNRPKVSMEMNTEGANEWSRITGANIGKRCAIVLDGVVYSAPTIQNKITGGRSEISGIPTLQDAKLIEIVLRAGSLPAPLSIIEERTIGPSLGEDSIRAGIISSIAALVLVAIFMIVYYKIGGTVSVVALMINVLFVFGILASFKATLTVPGIAGLILSIGMAVDTNVLIYERIREELKSGKPLKTSIDIGYKKAFSAIIDSHLTSLITGVILYQFGSGPIQGFALILIFGLLSNLFTAIIITHILFDLMTEKGYEPNFG
ncbi:MAG: protein translocase subunit SecD [Ignavibacteria bacterium]|nr:protein translocase subunit SecD [Ignavibacteria bacterium]